MGSRSFHIKLFALLVLLVISAAVLGWALSSSRMHLAILLGIVILVGAVFIFQQLTRSNREANDPSM